MKSFTYFNFLTSYPKFRLGSFCVAILCVFLLIIATFTQLNLGILTVPDAAIFHPIEYFSGLTSFNEIIKPYYYIPQIPIVLFIGALLGPRISFFVIAMYIVCGLVGFPVFASGGGIKYFAQHGFGYILGYFAAVFLVGRIMATKVTSWSIFRASIVGVVTIHVIGILYLILLLSIRHNTIFSIFGWIWTLTGLQFTYDLLMSFAAISLARPVRSILWMAMD